ncbi:hypothetical protein CAL7716_042290 [Calothrix sp. PCC 7716]|nr:hypothetical protein CAL7716_042290 [Calothrix sp. PCC 7716]
MKKTPDLFVSVSKTSKHHILIVDDNPDNILLLQFMLEGAGYQISSTIYGRDALEMVEIDTPDLIFLDLMMPDINGIEVASCIRSNPDTQDIPIVLVTAYNLYDLEDKDCKLLDGMLAKPIEENKLFSLLDCLIKDK